MSHAIDRAKERYGIELTTLDLREFADQIQDGRAVKLQKLRKGVVKYLVEHYGQKLPVVYHRKSGVIMSVLPPEAMEVQRYWTGTRWVKA